MPDPATDANYPWLYWASHKLFFTSSGNSGEGGAGYSLRRSFDIKSMRKLKPSESLAFVFQYSDIAGAPPLQFTAGQTRVLLAN